MTTPRVDCAPKPCLHKVANHEHGTYACYVLDRCRCQPCKTAHRDYNRNRRRLHLYGRYEGLVDAAPARAHVTALQKAGIGLKQIERLTGMSGGMMNKLMFGTPRPDGTRRPPAARIRPATAQKILAVQPTAANLAAGARIDSTGTIRRVQALVAMGWSMSKLAEELGRGQANFIRTLACAEVYVATARAVAQLYDALWDQKPPEQSHRDKIAASRARGHAKARGWLPPLAWDDDTIDRPEHRTGLTDADVSELHEHARAALIDEIAVERAMGGDHTVALTRPERIETIRRLRDLGLTWPAVERRLGMPDRTAYITFQRAANRAA